MPQRVTIKSIITKPTKKEGTNITTIEDEKGAKMSAFNDTALAQVHAGDILEVEVAIDGKYLNITGWKLIESKPQPEPLPSPEIKPPYKDNSASIEAQTAYKGIMEVWAAGQVIEQRLKDAATHYALLKLGWKAPEKPSDKAQDKGMVQSEDKKATVSPTESQKPIIDLAWLSETMKAVNWKDATLKSWLKMQFKTDTTGTIEDMLNRLNPNQANMLINHLKELAK